MGCTHGWSGSSARSAGGVASASPRSPSVGLFGAIAATVTTNPDEVKTRRLVVTDGEGRGRAVLTVDESDRTRLSLTDRDGATTADLTVTPGQSAALSVGRAGAQAQLAAVGETGQISVAARGPAGMARRRADRVEPGARQRPGQAADRGRHQPDPEPEPSAFRSRGQRRSGRPRRRKSSSAPTFFKVRRTLDPRLISGLASQFRGTALARFHNHARAYAQAIHK